MARRATDVGIERPTLVIARDTAAPAAASSRAVVGIVAGVVIVVGLAARSLLPDPAGDSVGGVLYASLIYLLCLLAAPRGRPLVVGLVAMVCALGVECFQLTPLPAAAAAAWWPSRLVLGTGFSWADLVTAAVGVVGSALVDTVLRRRRTDGARSSARPMIPGPTCGRHQDRSLGQEYR